MVTVELIKALVLPNKDAKESIEELLKNAYIGIQNLRKMSMDKTLTMDYIEEVESLFIKNQFNAEELHSPKYLQKYAKCLSQFWNSYLFNYNNWGIRHNEKYNLFDDLKKYDILMDIHYSAKNLSKIICRMEDFWMASNQVYTKYEISLIRKEYLR
jgi:hypothetical protein